MSCGDKELAFVEQHPAAAMITTTAGGVAKAVRIGLAVVDGRLWSSGTEDRVRTKRLRRDPRCTLFVFDAGYASLTLETTVTIIEGELAPAESLRMFRITQERPEGPLSWFGGELDDERFLEVMREEKRLIYEFEVTRSYGLF